MRWNVSSRLLRTSGRRASRNPISLLGLLLVLGCNYTFQGGGGFPSSIRTLYIEPFENQTAEFDLQQQIYQDLLQELPRALGVRPAAVDNADAIIRGRIVRYDDVAIDVSAGDANRAAQVLEHQVQITVAVEIIDVQRNLILWESSGITGRGSYRLAGESYMEGRAGAIEQLRQLIIDGAQSQW